MSYGCKFTDMEVRSTIEAASLAPSRPDSILDGANGSSETIQLWDFLARREPKFVRLTELLPLRMVR